MKQPIKKIQLGNVCASIWKHESEGAKPPRFTVSVNRSYQDADGNWKNTSFFNYSDLLAVAKAIDLAHRWIWNSQQTNTSKQREPA